MLACEWRLGNRTRWTARRASSYLQVPVVDSTATVAHFGGLLTRVEQAAQLAIKASPGNHELHSWGRVGNGQPALGNAFAGDFGSYQLLLASPHRPQLQHSQGQKVSTPFTGPCEHQGHAASRWRTPSNDCSAPCLSGLSLWACL